MESPLKTAVFPVTATYKNHTGMVSYYIVESISVYFTLNCIFNMPLKQIEMFWESLVGKRNLKSKR